ncbi:enoyl-CoA hydratase/isomerase family protein [Bacillus sp. ISL-47]|uniref:enoyl-CoA hydratase/isomerase family protein n=1 Tax=Bacillus sp. ISL-47 TaxID=2819130 RepID=UPI001BE8B362|nr:enoyl-CoA hydratase/isomerase family protein [Bacillus sp. ISL-47]MBT2688697.1 enoyl-CoA hydratase/isomerase family protein [Bacillus sp. ISL-47]MBT2707403.1 enoyl-CoA hydratase/isomerase family protein [Pseudomonas sp. ISL-84]
MENKNVLLTIENNVGIVTLNRPHAGNGIDLQLAKELMDTAIICSEKEEIRTVVITGSGNKFSVGGDLKSFSSEGEEMPAHLKMVTAYLHGAVSHFARMNKPFIGAVNGVAAGAGMSLALSCDLVYAAEGSKFVMAYNKIGLTPDGSGSYFLPRAVGMKRALELMYTNRMLKAKEAEEWGIVNQVLPEEELMPAVISLAENLAKGPMNAFGATKKLFYHSLHETLESQMAMETDFLADRAKSPEGKEGISAFLEKREAEFK